MGSLYKKTSVQMNIIYTYYANYITGFNRKTILTMSIKKGQQADLSN